MPSGVLLLFVVEHPHHSTQLISSRHILNSQLQSHLPNIANMVSFKSLAAAALAAVPTAMGYIIGFTAPESAAAGSNITATLQTAIYVQNWQDFSIVWGLSTPEYSCSNCVGTQIGYTPLT